MALTFAVLSSPLAERVVTLDADDVHQRAAGIQDDHLGRVELDKILWAEGLSANFSAHGCSPGRVRVDCTVAGILGPMRTKHWKDALYLGTWVTPRGQVLDVGVKDLQYFRDRTKAMLAAGKPVPWGIEHHDVEKASKLSAAERIRDWAEGIKGHLHDARIVKKLVPDATGAETLQDVLEFEMDVADADKPLLENLKSVSPELYPNFRDRHGPASDGTGPYWPGQSIGWLAVTGVPVQYPQTPFDFSSASPISLSAATVSVCLSQATYVPLSLSAGKPMPFPPKKKDEKDPKDPKDPADQAADPAADPAAADPAAVDPAADPLADAPGEDLEPGGPPLPPADDPADPAGDTALIMTLGQIIAPLGIEVHVQPGMTLRDYVSHLCTAGKTHVATKQIGEDEDEPDANANANQQPDPNQQPVPETAENAPIMMGSAGAIAMSAAQLTELEMLRKDKVTSASKSIKARLNALIGRGIIDETIANEELAKLKTVPIALSASRPGELATNPVEIAVCAWERLAKTGKAGMFAAPSAKPGPSIKPISDAVALSQAAEEAVDPPYAPEDGDASRVDVPLDKRVLERWGITANGKLA
jgi:hypothetical protein